MSTNQQKSADKLAYGCLAIIAIPIIAFFAWVFINDYQIRREVQKEQQAREELDARYTQELARLDATFERFFQKCSAEEREHYSLARDYFHTGEEASHDGATEYRQSKFDELEDGIRQMTELLDVMEKNPNLSPMQAKEMVKDFTCF